MMSEWIDAHVHVWTDDKARYPRASGSRDFPPAHFTPEDLFAHAHPNGVKRIVLVQMSFYRYDHSYLLASMAAHPGTFSAIGIVDAGGADPAADMIALQGKGARGFRITPGSAPGTWLDAPGMLAMWRCAGERGLAMCPLIGPEQLPAIGRMCERFPDTRVVIDHLARIGIDGAVKGSDVRALAALAAHRNVYVKVSAFYALGSKAAPYADLEPMVRIVFDAYGPKRLMWGSDCPFQVQDGHTYKASVDFIRQLGFLSADDREWLMGKTAAALFFA
jgi:predicted TIM-barrel fold metal-dependent hydrolase